MIRIPLDRPLKEIEKFLRSGNPYEQAVKSGLIIDPHNGYREWKSRSMRVINWSDIVGDPALTSIRLLRMYLKVGLVDWPPLLKQRLKSLVAQQKQLHRLPEDEAFGKERIPRAIRKVLKEGQRLARAPAHG